MQHEQQNTGNISHYAHFCIWFGINVLINCLDFNKYGCILPPSIYIMMIITLMIMQVCPYLHSWGGSEFPCGSGGHHGSSLCESSRHLWRHSCGPGWACYTRHITYQPHTAIYLDVRVALCSHVQNLEAIVVKARELTLKGPAAITTTNCNCCLGVENC